MGERAREGEGGWEKGEEVGGLHIAAEEGDAVSALSSSLLLGFFFFSFFLLSVWHLPFESTCFFGPLLGVEG